jgi:hypothetical protein
MNLEKRVVKFENAKRKVDSEINYDDRLHVIVIKNGDDEVYYKSGKLPFCYDGISFTGKEASPKNLLKMYNDCNGNIESEEVSMDFVLREVTHNLNWWRFHKKYSF